MPIAVETGHFVKATATGNQDVLIATDGTALADGSWLLILETDYSDRADLNVGSGSGGVYEHMIGAACKVGGTVKGCAVGTCGVDLAATTDTQRRWTNAASFSVPKLDATGPVDEATFVSFPDATHFRLNWSVNGTGVPAKVNYTLITGLRGANIITFQAPATAITKDVTGFGFTPDWGMILGAPSNAAAAGTSANGRMTLGMWDLAGEQFSNVVADQDARAGSTQAAKYERTNKVLGLINGAGTVQEEAAWNANLGDGVQLSFGTVDANQSYYFAVGVLGVTAKIGTFNSAASPQTVSHNLGQTVRGAFFVDATKAAGTVGDANAANTSLGMTDGTNHRGGAMYSLGAAAATSADKSVWTNTRSLVDIDNTGATPAVKQAGTAAFTNTNDLTVTWNTASAGLEWCYCVLADGPPLGQQVISVAP